jgi:fatty-acyl-CoA synthase
MTMAQALKHVAEQHPTREALVCGPYRATYGQLVKTTESLARGLRDLGIGEGDRVATVLHPCPEFIHLFFALAWLGGVIVPIDPQSRRRQLTHLLSDAEPLAVVTSAHIGGEALETIRDWGVTSSAFRHLILAERESVPGLSLADTRSAAPSAPLTPFPADPDDLLALLYTSGTTGLPKGAMHSHRNLIAAVVASLRLRQMWIQRPSPQMMGRWAKVLGRYGPRLLRAVGRPQTFVSTVGCHNITGLEVILQALLMGDRLVMMPHFNPIETLRLVEQERATILIAVPMAFSVMVRLKALDRFDLSSLLICGTGSAPCPAELARQIQERFKCAVHIGFGATELAGGISATSLEDSDRLQVETVGQAMPGMEIKIVDEQRQELPPGQIGELACRGDNVMMGYYRSPDRTAQVVDEEGWYYTGDLAMMDEQGYLRIMGRKDDMIIRGGQNIYPAEIEEYLISHPNIKEVAMVGIPSEIGGESVWAFIVLEDGVEMSGRQVVQHCRAELEIYKIPDRIEFMADLPRSTAGKVQKFRLREMALQEAKEGNDGN